MTLAIIGSRTLQLASLQPYIPSCVTKIVSGGAKGIDQQAKEYAVSQHILYQEYLPEYEKYGKAAPLKRNKQIVQAADAVIAFWDGKSRGTKYTIDYAKRIGKNVNIYLFFRETTILFFPIGSCVSQNRIRLSDQHADLLNNPIHFHSFLHDIKQ